MRKRYSFRETRYVKSTSLLQRTPNVLPVSSLTRGYSFYAEEIRHLVSPEAAYFDFRLAGHLGEYRNICDNVRSPPLQTDSTVFFAARLLLDLCTKSAYGGLR